MFQKIFRSFIASIVGFLLFTSVFSSFSDLSTDAMIGNMFDDIYEYADTSSKKNTIDRMSANCVALLGMDEEVTTSDLSKYSELCEDSDRRRQLEETCPKLPQLEVLLLP